MRNNNTDKFITLEMIENKKFLIQLFISLSSHRENNSEVIRYNSLKELADELNVNEKTFNRQLKALEAEKVITIDKKLKTISINKIELERGRFTTLTEAEADVLMAVGADDFVIKVYCYIKFLINKYKKICDETQKQILEALSYSDSPTNKSKLKNAVKTLEDANLIQTENFFDERGKRRIEYKLRVAPKATIKTNVMAAAAVPKGFKF